MQAALHLIGIAAMAAKYGISIRTLRFYEQQGLIQPLRRGQSRFYSGKDEVRLELILKGRRLGFTLLEIGKLIGLVGRKEGPADAEPIRDFLDVVDPATIERQTEELERRRAEVDAAIATLKSELAARA